MKFFHAHVHSVFSHLDGLNRPEEIVNSAVENGYVAAAVTDHGFMGGVPKLFAAARNTPVIPVAGVEIYMVKNPLVKKHRKEDREKRHHLVLLALDRIGYTALCSIMSRAWTEGFYYKPRTSLEWIEQALVEKGAKGHVAALTACINGEVADLILSGGSEEDILRLVNRYAEVFGRENFYLEVQPVDVALKEAHEQHREWIEKQTKVNQTLTELALKNSFGLVMTFDAHYPRAEDWKIHDVLLKGRTDGGLSSIPGQHLRSAAEVEEALASLPSGKDTISLIEESFERLTDSLKRYELNEGYVLPAFASSKEEEDALLEKLAREGLERLIAEDRLDLNRFSADDYRARLEYELKVIRDMGFSGYFLIVQDFVNQAKEKGIFVGPGRGSAAGALVSMCLGITELDPLRWGLLFERFLNPDRVSMPDIDIDFCARRRDEVIEYLKDRYGHGSVARIVAHGSLQTKAAIREVMRHYNVPARKINAVSKLIPSEVKSVADIDDATRAALEEVFREQKIIQLTVDELLAAAEKYEGLVKAIGVHAAGVVITPGKVSNYLPVATGNTGSKNTREIISQYDKDDLESLGYLKIDILGLKTLSVLQEALNIIKERHGVEIDFNRISLDDEKVYEMLSGGDTLGVFQLESRGMQEMLKRLKPSRFEDLIAAVALYRPGPLNSGMVDDYIERKHGRQQAEYEFPELESILEETYGVVIYQEQVMKIAVELAGFTMAEADTLRKAMGKKKKDLMDQMREKFITGAVARGYDRQKIEALFDKLAKFAEYGFNKSHSAAYATIAYRTAYLKAHYPLEYMTAYLTSVFEEGKTDKAKEVIAWMYTHGIEVLPVDINHSGWECRVEGHNAVRLGFCSVKNFGQATAEAILTARSNGRFTGIEDFITRVSIPVSKIEVLIKAGAFLNLASDMHPDVMLKALANIMPKIRKTTNRNQMSLPFLSEIGEAILNSAVARLEKPSEEGILQLKKYEKEAYGFSLSELKEMKDLEKKIKESVARAKKAGVKCLSLLELDNIQHEDACIVTGVVEAFEERKSRKGNSRYYVAAIKDNTAKKKIFIAGRQAEDGNLLVILNRALETGECIYVSGVVRDGKFWVENAGSEANAIFIPSVFFVLGNKDVYLLKAKMQGEDKLFRISRERFIERLYENSFPEGRTHGCRLFFIVEDPQHGVVAIDTKRYYAGQNLFNGSWNFKDSPVGIAVNFGEGTVWLSGGDECRQFYSDVITRCLQRLISNHRSNRRLSAKPTAKPAALPEQPLPEQPEPEQDCLPAFLL